NERKLQNRGTERRSSTSSYAGTQSPAAPSSRFRSGHSPPPPDAHRRFDRIAPTPPPPVHRAGFCTTDFALLIPTDRWIRVPARDVESSPGSLAKDRFADSVSRQSGRC